MALQNSVDQFQGSKTKNLTKRVVIAKSVGLMCVFLHDVGKMTTICPITKKVIFFRWNLAACKNHPYGKASYHKTLKIAMNYEQGTELGNVIPEL